MSDMALFTLPPTVTIYRQSEH